MLRIVAVGLTLIGLLVTIKSQQVLQRAHLIGSCSRLAQIDNDTEWRSCVPGKVSGRPGLLLDSCTDWGRRGNAEIWNCPAALDNKAPRE